MSPNRRSFRFWILTLTVLGNLAIASSAMAAWTDASCEDPDTGEVFLCCRSCWFFCHCSIED